MVNPAKPTLVTAAHLRRLLEAHRKASPLPPSPITTFMTIEDRLLNPEHVDVTPAIESIVITWIIDEIAAAYNGQRQLSMLPSVPLRCNRAAARAMLTEDFQSQLDEMASWSVLYYRFVRVDLDFSLDEMAQFCAVNERTLRRRQKHGLERLVSRLLSIEQAARQESHTQHLKRSIPADTSIKQVGLTAPVDKVLALFQEGPCHHVVLVGPGGIGKTTLAISVTRHLIESDGFRRLVWLRMEQGMDCAGVLEAIQLQISPVHLRQKPLTQLLPRDKTLIVLDEFEHILLHQCQPTEIVAMLEQISDAHLIMTSRKGFPHDSIVHSVELRELCEEDSIALMQAAWPTHRFLDAPTQQTISYLAGGNPRAIVLATRIVAQMPQAILQNEQIIPMHIQHEVMLKQLYEYAWDHLQDEARYVWLAAYLLPEKQMSSDLFGYVSGVGGTQLSLMIEQLGLLSLLYWDADSQSFSLQNVARQFLHIVAQSNEHDHWLRTAIGRLCNALWGRANAAILVMHLMRLPQHDQVDSNQRLTLFKAAWPSVSKNGLWQAWLALLEQQWQDGDFWDAEAKQWFCYWLGVTQRWLADYDKAAWWLSEGLHIGGQCSDPPAQTLCLIELAVLHRHKGQLASAVATIQHATSLAHKQRDAAVTERCLLESAQIAMDSSRYQEVNNILAKAAPSARASMLFSNLKVVEKDYETALFHAKQALRAAPHDQPNLARAHASIGRVYIGLKLFALAEDHLSLANALMEKHHDYQAAARTQTLLGQLDVFRGDTQNALHQLEDAADKLRDMGDAVGLFHTLQILLDVYLRIAEQALAAEQMDDAHDLSVKMACLETEWQRIGDAMLE